MTSDPSVASKSIIHLEFNSWCIMSLLMKLVLLNHVLGMKSLMT